MNNWKETTLGEVLKVDESTIDNNYPFDEIEYIDIASVEERNILQTQKIKLQDAPSRAKRIVRDNDILISTVRPNLKHYCYIKRAFPNLIASTGFAVITAKKADPSYLYYLLTTNEYTNYLTQIAEGHTSAYPSFNPEVIENSVFVIPPLPEQKAIAAILSSFDDKIELLRRQNKTLESIAQTIFKEWFIKFRIKNAELRIYTKTGLPEGWRMGKLEEELSVAIGGDWGEETKTSGDDVQAFCLRGTDIDSLKLNGYSAQVPIRWIRKGSFEKRVITENDILIGGSGLGPIGKTVYCHPNINLVYEFPITYSNFCKRLTAKNKYYALYFEYVLSKLYKQGSLERFFIGTSIPNLDMNGLLEEMVVIPSENHIQEFAQILEFRYAKLINPQIQTLSKLRDALLPKLMKGEIRLKLSKLF